MQRSKEGNLTASLDCKLVSLVISEHVVLLIVKVSFKVHHSFALFQGFKLIYFSIPY